MGSLIARRHRRNAIGWLFCAIGLFFGGVVLSEEYAIHGLAVAPSSLPAADLVGYATVWLFPIGPALILLVFLLFPSGRAKSQAWGATVAHATFSQAAKIEIRVGDLDRVTSGQLGRGQALIRLEAG